MIINKKVLASTVLVASICFLGGCQSVHKDLVAEIPDAGKPGRPDSGDMNAVVQVPDLDERREDTQYLSKIDRLQKKVFDLSRQLNVALEERTAAVKSRDAATRNEASLSELIEDYETNLASAADREKKLKERLLRAELESVRCQQMVADMKIQDLTKGSDK